jgi:hypothetical protein
MATAAAMASDVLCAFKIVSSLRVGVFARSSHHRHQATGASEDAEGQSPDCEDRSKAALRTVRMLL